MLWRYQHWIFKPIVHTFSFVTDLLTSCDWIWINLNTINLFDWKILNINDWLQFFLNITYYLLQACFYIFFNNCSLVGNYICPDLQVVMQVENIFYVQENAFHNKFNTNYLRKIFVFSFSADLHRRPLIE